MSGIPRYRMINSIGHQDNENGAWVRYEDHVAAVEAAVLAERVRCLKIVEEIHGYSVKPDGNLSQDPEGEMVIRMRVETAIRWVKVK